MLQIEMVVRLGERQADTSVPYLSITQKILYIET